MPNDSPSNGASGVAEEIRSRLTIAAELVAPVEFSRLHHEIAAAIGQPVTQGALGQVLDRGNARISNYENPDSPLNKQAKLDVSMLLRYVHADVTGDVLQWSAKLDQIAAIIEDVDHRCMAVDGPVTPTDQEIRLDEIRAIYQLAGGDGTPPLSSVMATGAAARMADILALTGRLNNIGKMLGEYQSIDPELLVNMREAVEAIAEAAAGHLNAAGGGES